MEYRFLGNSGLKVSALSLGGWINFDTDAGYAKNAEIMKAAFAAGINFFDTAEAYAKGKSEIAFGQVFKEVNWPRSSYVVSTKLYWSANEVDGIPNANASGLSRKRIIEGLKASLKRLQLDYVDVVFAHRPDDLTPMEEIVRAFNWCIDQGLTFYWGVSEWSAEQIMDAHRVAEKLNLVGPLVEQPQYNMLHRERFEKEYEPLFRKYKLGTTIWSPLASGVLTGKYVNGIPEGSRLAGDGAMNKMILARHQSPEGQAKNAKVVKLIEVASTLGCSVAQLALAWCLTNKNVSTAILGATSVEQLKENLKALEVVPKLTPEVLEKIEVILDNKPTLPVARM